MSCIVNFMNYTFQDVTTHTHVDTVNLQGPEHAHPVKVNKVKTEIIVNLQGVKKVMQH